MRERLQAVAMVQFFVYLFIAHVTNKAVHCVLTFAFRYWTICFVNPPVVRLMVCWVFAYCEHLGAAFHAFVCRIKTALRVGEYVIFSLWPIEILSRCLSFVAMLAADASIIFFAPVRIRTRRTLSGTPSAMMMIRIEVASGGGRGGQYWRSCKCKESSDFHFELVLVSSCCY